MPRDKTTSGLPYPREAETYRATDRVGQPSLENGTQVALVHSGESNANKPASL